MHERVSLIVGPFVSMYAMELIGTNGVKVRGTHMNKQKLRVMLLKKYKASA